jgi:hypothetical protein
MNDKTFENLERTRKGNELYLMLVSSKGDLTDDDLALLSYEVSKQLIEISQNAIR